MNDSRLRRQSNPPVAFGPQSDSCLSCCNHELVCPAQRGRNHNLGPTHTWRVILPLSPMPSNLGLVITKLGLLTSLYSH